LSTVKDTWVLIVLKSVLTFYNVISCFRVHMVMFWGALLYGFLW